jgi:hypothetical protein
MPVSFRHKRGEKDELFPLYRGRGTEGIFDQVELQLQLSTRRRGCPTISFGHTLYTINSKGGDTPKKGWKAASLFTVTSKMTAPSFSLPAGPTNRGGTCVAANRGKQTGGLRKEGQTYICDECYAFQGNYIFPNVATVQAARYYWVIQQLEADPTGELLAQELIRALDDYARNGTLSSSAEGSVERFTQEFGVWDGSQIQVPIWFKAIEQVRYYPAIETSLPQQVVGVSDSRELFKRRGTRPGEVCGFFRIHDSGGFTPGTKPTLWPSYIRAWARVAQAFPNVFFWAPARVYVIPKLKQILQEVAQVDNLVIRPSALNVGDPAPGLTGLSAGTTVAPKVRGGFAPTYDASGQPTYQCPVYLHAVSHSCMGAGCRACWISPQTTVAYGFKD